ncbi:pre-mRNA-splicing factor 8 [Fusarium poae]|uniref:Uncharacterized protein n=2 Tax=Fusarium poae TaxID=36050 RepID=A0A1B8B798_FUSPO|nr:hypothetical protein FPOA_02527 [Fusarium poae]
MPNLGSSFTSSLVFRERHSSPVESIPPNALSELRSDDDFMSMVGDSQISNSDEDYEEDVAGFNDENDIDDLDFIDATSDADEDDDEEEPEEGQRHVRLQTGRHAYGDLQDDERDQLISEITTHSNTSTKSGANTLLNAL